MTTFFETVVAENLWIFALATFSMFAWVLYRLQGCYNQSVKMQETLKVQLDDQVNQLVLVRAQLSGESAARKAAEESLRLFSAIAEHSPLAVIVTNPLGKVQYVNAQFVQMTGYLQSEISGDIPQGLQAVLFAPYSHKNLWTAIQQGRSWREEFFNQSKDGKYYWEDAFIFPVADDWGKVLYFVGIKRDITEEKKVEELLSLTRERITVANQSKSEFLAGVSHEIRTPLNAILGLGHLLSQTALNGKQREFVEKIHIAGLHMLDTLNDILDYARIESEGIVLEPVVFSLDDILKHLEQTLLPDVKKKGINLKVRCDQKIPKVLRGDASRLEQILLNLVGNGVKFTDCGFVELSVDLDEACDKVICLRFTIRDTGIGMSETQRNRLFNPLMRKRFSMFRHFGGTGVSLIITHRLIQMMGGEIEVLSELGQGSAFTFTIRLGLSPEISEEMIATRSKQSTALHGDSLKLKGTNILLVEDEPLNQVVVEEILTQAGANVILARNGLEALGVFTGDQKEPVHLVLMDIQIPEMDGLETTHHIRKLGFNRLPIIAMTANAMDQDKKHCLASGMNDYLVKPINVDYLFLTICKWLPAEACREIHASSLESSYQNYWKYYSGIDIKLALSRLAGNKKLFVDLLTSFIQHYEGISNPVREAMAVRDKISARRFLHTLKGVAGNLGAHRLQQQVMVAERALAQESATLDDELELLNQQIHQVLQSARQIVAEKCFSCYGNKVWTSNPQQQLAEQLALIKALHEALLKSNLRAIHYANDLNKILTESSHVDIMFKIQSLVNALQFGQADDLLCQLAKILEISLV